MKSKEENITDRFALISAVFQALGEASMCWSPKPKGIFDSTEALEIGDRLMKEIDLYLESKKEKV